MSVRRVCGSLLWVAVVLSMVACGGDEPDMTRSSTRGVAPSAAGAFGGPAALPGAQPAAGAPAPAPTAGAATASTPIPCNVATVVADNCLGCHGQTPMGGAIQLLSHEDWHRASPVYDPAKKVYEVAQIRIANGEMPQGAVMPAPDRGALEAWLAGGAVAGGAGDAACPATGMQPPAALGEGPAAVDDGIGADYSNECERPGARDPLVARPGETCYDFPVAAPGGVGKFDITPGESYHEWYYAVPWAPTDLISRYGADFDNVQVLHHFLIFASNAAGKAPGQLDQNVLGTTLGSSATLIGGWAVGGCGLDLPPDVGGEIPSSSLIMIQWHMFNSTGVPQQDGTRVQICTVPAGQRPNVAGITFLGTENFNGPFGMPPGPNDFTTECSNHSGAPVELLGFTPHMHTIGSHMRTDLRRLDGNTETIFDEPFQFDYQVGYRIPRTTMEAGETLITTCSFFNDTATNVAFGQSTNQEMCYQYVLYHPAGALNNGVASLIGALNTCW